MKISIEDTTFCVTGNFTILPNRQAIESALADKGGLISKSLTAKTQVLVLGREWLKQQRKRAEIKGIYVMEEAELKTLLEQGYVVVDFENSITHQGNKVLDELLGEVRGVLAKGASKQTWEALTIWLDDCSSEQEEELANYVEGHISRWSSQQQLLCTAPKNWIVRMSQGLSSPLYRLVRDLCLDCLDFNGTAVNKMLKCEDLINLRSLNLCVEKKLSATALKTLCNESRFSQLEHLVLGFLDEKMAAVLSTTTGLTSIRSLGIAPERFIHMKSSLFHDIFRSPMAQGVETLVLHFNGGSMSSGYTCFALGVLKDQSVMPNLRHIDVDFVGQRLDNIMYFTPNYVNDSLNQDFLAPRIRELTLKVATDYYVGEKLQINHLNHLEDMNIFAYVRPQPYKVSNTVFNTMFNATVRPKTISLPPSLKRWTTNLPEESTAIKALKERGLTVVCDESLFPRGHKD